MSKIVRSITGFLYGKKKQAFRDAVEYKNIKTKRDKILKKAKRNKIKTGSDGLNKEEVSVIFDGGNRMKKLFKKEFVPETLDKANNRTRFKSTYFSKKTGFTNKKGPKFDKPDGMKKGKFVQAKCKLGRNRPTQLY